MEIHYLWPLWPEAQVVQRRTYVCNEEIAKELQRKSRTEHSRI